MRWTKSLILASLFLSVSAFSNTDSLWKDTRTLHNSAWEVVQLIEGNNKLSHITSSIRDFANRTGDLKHSIQANAPVGKIRSDLARLEHTFGYLMTRLRSVESSSQYKKISSKVNLMKSRYFRIHGHLVSNYNFRNNYRYGAYGNYPGYGFNRGYYNGGYYNNGYNNGYYNRSYNGSYYNRSYIKNGSRIYYR